MGQFRLWTNALRRLEYGEKLLNYYTSREWLEKLSEEQGDIQRACLSPTLHSNFQFVPEISALLKEVKDLASDDSIDIADASAKVNALRETMHSMQALFGQKFPTAAYVPA